MQRVWSNPSLVQCDLMKAILEMEGIKGVILNENSARFAGVGYPLATGQSLGFAWPEIWVADEDAEAARELVDRVSSNRRGFWEHEINEDSDM